MAEREIRVPAPESQQRAGKVYRITCAQTETGGQLSNSVAVHRGDTAESARVEEKLESKEQDHGSRYPHGWMQTMHRSLAWFCIDAMWHH